MCLIVLAWRADARYTLLLGANRDEFHQRPSAAADWWRDAPQVVGGRDLKAGGTWLGATREGRFAAVTNFRDPRAQRPDARTRGELAASYLTGHDAPESYAASAYALRNAYNPFNLLLGDRDECWFVGSREPGPARLGPGVHGLSNASLDTRWPKVERSRRLLESALGSAEPERMLLAGLGDRVEAADVELPDTGIGIELERHLSPPFIVGDLYGTRATTILSLWTDGSMRLVEQAYGPGGTRGARAEFDY
jgi:uncharacterized protein with NRDE domain